MPCVSLRLPRGFRTIEALESSNAKLYDDFNSLVWHHVRRFQKWHRIPEHDLEDVVPALWAKLLRTSKRYRNPAGMNLVIVNRLKRVLEERKLAARFDSSEEIPDFPCSSNDSHMQMMRSEMIRLRGSEVAVLSLVLLHKTADRKQAVLYASRVLERESWWIERKIESAKVKLPALETLISI